MLCCMALSANACGTDGTHQQTAENEITGGGDENENNTEESGEGLFDLTQGENGKPPVITLSSGYTMPVLGLGTYSLHGDECIKATVAATSGVEQDIDTLVPEHADTDLCRRNPQCRAACPRGEGSFTLLQRGYLQEADRRQQGAADYPRCQPYRPLRQLRQDRGVLS